MNSLGKLIVMLTLLTLAFTILASPAEAEDATLTVKVLTVDGEPLKNAHLEIKNSTNNEVVATGETGSDGKASFSLELYNYSITVYYPEGHEVGSEDVNFNETKTVTISVDVISGWTIRVYDKKERDPVEGANVTITHQGDSSIRYWRLTDENGKAGFGPIPCDSSYKVVVKFRGEEYDEGAKSPTAGDVKVKLPLYRVVLTILDRKSSPVEGVLVELREELDADPIASATSDLDGEAVLKLIPNGNYYLTAKLKGITVYQTEGKDITVLNDDVSEEITVNAVKLNVTVMDADGEDVMKNYTLTGKLIKNGEVVAEATATDGILHFGHTPFEAYKLEIAFGDLELYSETYEVNVDTAEGSVKALFYDVEFELNASALANASLARALSGELSIQGLEIRFEVEDWKASLRNVPRSEAYTVTLFRGGEEVAEIKPVKIVRDDQAVKLNLTGYRIILTTLNLDEKPVSAEVKVYLPGVGVVTSFETNESGRGESGQLLPLTYEVEALIEGSPARRESVKLENRDASMTLILDVKDMVFRVFDRDGEDLLGNVSLQLIRGSLKRSASQLENKTIIVKNLPIGEYRVIVSYYGFKVLDRMIDISRELDEEDLKAMGVLDAELIFLDSRKKPLDGGVVKLSFGGISLEREISEKGRVYFENLPNITMSLEAFYRGVKLSLEPSEFDLTRDGMRVTVISSVHKLAAKVLRGDGKPLRVGQALVYLNDILESSYNLTDGNEISERLPEGELRIVVKYKGREAGLLETYLERSIEDLAVYSTVFPLTLHLYDPDGNPVQGALILVKDDLGMIAEEASDEQGVAEILLPAGSYEASIMIDNRSYDVALAFEKSRTISFLYPASGGGGFELAISAGAINLAISGYAISRVSRRRPGGGRRGRRARSRPRRVPRV